MSHVDGLAESLAIVQPEPIRDSLRDILRDAVVQWSGSLPRDETELKAQFFRLIDQGFTQARDSGAALDVDSLAASEMISEALFRLKDLLGTRLHIYALLICLGKISEPEEEVARELGVTKQAVSKAKITVQAFFNLPCRVGRKDESRAKFCALAMTRQPKTRTRWTGQKYFARL
jgi:hypothetical protein